MYYVAEEGKTWPETRKLASSTLYTMCDFVLSEKSELSVRSTRFLVVRLVHVKCTIFYEFCKFLTNRVTGFILETVLH